jgi:hypothetical protein
MTDATSGKRGWMIGATCGFIGWVILWPFLAQ